MLFAPPSADAADSRIARRLREIRWRTAALQNARDRILEKGLDSAMQTEVFQEEQSPMKALFDRATGKFVLFDGNGRFKAISGVFANHPDLQIEVEVWDTEDATVWRRLHEIMEARGVGAVDGK